MNRHPLHGCHLMVFTPCWAAGSLFRVGVPLQDFPSEGPKIGQELAKHVLPVYVSMVGPEGFEPPTKRL